MKEKSKVKLLFNLLFLLTIFGLKAQQQVDFGAEVSKIESLINNKSFAEANDALIALQESLANTSLIQQDTVKLFFSSKLAFVAYQLGDCEQTIKRSKKDIALREQIYGIGDPITLSANRNLGIYYLNCDSLEKADSVLNVTVQMHKTHIGRPDQLYAQSLDDWAYTQGQLGNVASASQKYEELLELMGPNKGSFYLHVVENYSALLMSAEKYDQAATFFDDLKPYMAQKPEYPFFLKDYYNVFVHTKDYVKALEAASELLAYCDANKSNCAEMETEEFILNSARLATLLYKYPEAERFYQRAQDIFKETPLYPTILLEEAQMYGAIGEKYKQINTLTKSLMVHRMQNLTDSGSYTKTVLELGRIFTEMGRFQRADELFSEYINDLEQEENVDSEKLALAYQSLGNQKYLLQNFKEADMYLAKSREILDAEGLSNSKEYASVLNSLGALYEALANYERAESNYRHALRLASNEDSGLRIALATNLANILTRTNPQNDSILTLLIQAIQWQSQSIGKSHPNYANLLSNRAVYHQKNENYDKALMDYEEAIKIFSYTVQEDHPQYLSALANLGLLYDLMDRKEEALKTMLEAKEKYLTYYSISHPGYLRTVNNLANLYTKLQKYDLAEPLLMSLSEAQVNEINESFTYLSESEKKIFVEEKQKLLNNFKSYVVTRSTNEPGSIKPEVIEAWYNLELSTKGMLLNATKKVREQIFKSGDEELVRLFSEWTVTRKQIADLQSLKSDLQKNNKGQLDSLLQKTNALEKALSRKSAAFGSSFATKAPSFDQIRQRLMPQEATVEIIRTELNGEGVYTALIGTSSLDYPTLIVLGKGENFEKKAYNVYKNAIKFKLEDTKSFDSYWGNIHAFLNAKGIEKIYYAPDGIYHKISINTLYNPETKSYLIDELTIVQLSSTKDILSLDLNTAKTDQVSSILLVGRPAYKYGEHKALVGSTRSFRMLTDVSDLPGTEEEIREIQQLVEKNNIACEVLLKEEAEEGVVKSKLNKELIHIATHGFFMEDAAAATRDPMLSSGLLLAGVSNASAKNDEDGILTAYEIMNLGFTNLKLVVLSACETGLGEIASGEGIYGLQRAFFVGGARAVIMSLWKVDDEATKDLMATFYKDYLKSGNKRESFLSAQKKIKKKYKDPIYWGAFVLLGG